MENMDRKVIMNREEEAMSSCCPPHHGNNNCGKIDINCNNVNIYVSCCD